MTKIRYALGFAFDETYDRVVLIRKNKPEWQRGKLNGVGGKIEDFDSSPHDAMIREFKEETGLLIPQWRKIATMVGSDFEIFCFASHSDAIERVVSAEAEKVGVHHVGELYRSRFEGCVSGVSWLVPLCKDPDSERIQAIFSYAPR